MSYVPARSPDYGGALEIRSSGWLATREQRRAARDITRIRIRGAVVTAREVAKVEVVDDVSQAALIAASDVSSLEAALIQRTPHAQARLQHLADSGSAAMASIVLRAGKAL